MSRRLQPCETEAAALGTGREAATLYMRAQVAAAPVVAGLTSSMHVKRARLHSAGSLGPNAPAVRCDARGALAAAGLHPNHVAQRRLEVVHGHPEVRHRHRQRRRQRRRRRLLLLLAHADAGAAASERQPRAAEVQTRHEEQRAQAEQREEGHSASKQCAPDPGTRLPGSSGVDRRSLVGASNG